MDSDTPRVAVATGAGRDIGGGLVRRLVADDWLDLVLDVHLQGVIRTVRAPRGYSAAKTDRRSFTKTLATKLVRSDTTALQTTPHGRLACPEIRTGVQVSRAAIVATAGTPIGRAYRGPFNNTFGVDLAAHAISGPPKGRPRPEPRRTRATSRTSSWAALSSRGRPASTSHVAIAAKQILVDGMRVAIGGGVESISQRGATAAQVSGSFAEEIVPISVTARRDGHRVDNRNPRICSNSTASRSATSASGRSMRSSPLKRSTAETCWASPRRR